MPSFIRVRWQVSSKARRGDCRATFVPLKNRVEGEYRDVPAAPSLGEEIDADLAQWVPAPVALISPSRGHRRLSVLFAPSERGKGMMPIASAYDYVWHRCR
ncbi:hypothetical protein [Streptomyces sp. HC307]|uniref:hypothetical protein n=1 Tax=Streptomyces flavusporus TaxID=3385496 RepID=UPI0039176353